MRVELNPQALFKYGIGLEDVRAALVAANAHSPKGAIEDRRPALSDLRQRSGHRRPPNTSPLIVAYRNGAPVRLTDVGEVTDGVENLRNAGLANGKPSVLVILYRQPGANIIDDGRPHQGAAAGAAGVDLAGDRPRPSRVDRSTTIRASLRDVERTLMIAIVPRDPGGVRRSCATLRATLIPSVAVPVSLIGTFGAMYLLGYSLDNLSLMALTIATGFVVDDAIVVLENISRHIEAGHVAARGRAARARAKSASPCSR